MNPPTSPFALRPSSFDFRPSTFDLRPSNLPSLLLALASILLGTPSSHAAEPTPALALFNGRDLTGWRAPTGDWLAVQTVQLDPADPKRLTSTPGTGVLLNGPTSRTVNLITAAEWGDVELHVEFCLPRGSNSGVYLMGRYEVQVYDSFGVTQSPYPGIECGGIYPRWTEARGEFEGHSPRVNASLPPGEWQSFDITFTAPRFDATGRKTAPARFVQVRHNGRLIHENIALTGPTRAAVWEAERDEKPTGPLMLQGDHGPVAYRNLRLRPLTSAP
ncbi:MAG: DUF1080 domain-containing protein [Verrucomicrobiales bacterium]|nr:DUF1080 domain-containing protein [Verrucomicrobiales bacterium]